MHADEPSLQSHLEELRARTGIPEGGVSTVIICGKMRSENDSAEILAMHRSIVEDEVNREGSNVTGLLVGQGVSVIHLLEGPSYALLRIAKLLADHPQYSGENGSTDLTQGALQQGRVVYNVEDRPMRYFTEWYSCVLAEKKGGTEELNGDTGKDVVHDLATSLLEMGTRLQQTTGAVDLATYADLMPAKGLILALNACSAFFTLDEYVSLYSEPFHADLESEMVYPMQRLVAYI